MHRAIFSQFLWATLTSKAILIFFRAKEEVRVQQRELRTSIAGRGPQTAR